MKPSVVEREECEGHIPVPSPKPRIEPDLIQMRSSSVLGLQMEGREGQGSLRWSLLSRPPVATRSWLLWPGVGSRTLFFLLSTSLGPLSGTQKPRVHPLSCSSRTLKCPLDPESFATTCLFQSPQPQVPPIPTRSIT